MLNETRYHSIKKIFQETNINLAEEEIIQYSDAYEIISQFTHNKLTDKEMVAVVMFFGKVILGKVPQVAVHVAKEERIQIQYRLMEKATATKGKLTSEEKEGLAFCIYWIHCVKCYDEEKNQIVSGLTDFISYEHILRLLQEEKKKRPEFFEKEEPPADPSTYGLTVDNPVRLGSIQDAYVYLRSLRHNGFSVEVDPDISSMKGKNGHIIDRYTVTVISKGFLFKKKEQRYLFLDCYAKKPLIMAPPDFTLV